MNRAPFTVVVTMLARRSSTGKPYSRNDERNRHLS
jgi:hypothetical protein